MRRNKSRSLFKKSYKNIVEENIFINTNNHFIEKEDYLFRIASIKDKQLFIKTDLKIKALLSTLIPLTFLLVYKIIDL